jgi:hypothetical protein
MQFNSRFEPLFTTDEFYDPAKARGRARKLSRERDFGVMWREAAQPNIYHRITWVYSTGEFMAVCGNQIQILGIVKGETAAEADAALDGWAEACTAPDGLAWARKQLADLGAATPDTCLPQGRRRISGGFEIAVTPLDRSLEVLYNDIGGEINHGIFKLRLASLPKLISQGRALLTLLTDGLPHEYRVDDNHLLISNPQGTLIDLIIVVPTAPRASHDPLTCRSEPWEFAALLSGLDALMGEVYESLDAG